MSQNSKATDGSSSSSDASQDLFDGMEIDPSSGDDEVEMEDMMVTCCGIQSAKTDDSNGITVVWAATQKEQEHYGSIRGQEKKDSDEVNVADVKNLSIGTEEIKLKEVQIKFKFKIKTNSKKKIQIKKKCKLKYSN